MNYVSDDNFFIYAAKHYDNPTCATQKEFEEDLNRIKFLHKMFKRYEKDGFMNERLVLNHLILLYNVFERDACTKILAFKLNKHLHILKPFLVLLSFWPERIEGVGAPNIVIIGTNIGLDNAIVERLRKI